MLSFGAGFKIPLNILLGNLESSILNPGPNENSLGFIRGLFPVLVERSLVLVLVGVVPPNRFTQASGNAPHAGPWHKHQVVPGSSAQFATC